jgi:putative nucleotidyltransferase with HDIG domain
MPDVERLLRAADTLDPVPVSVSRLLAVVSRDRWAFADVEQIISHDQALTGRLLQVANSAANAAMMPIGTVRDAVIRVGIGPVLSFAMAACVGRTLRRALPEYGLSEGELWAHSVATSLAVEVTLAMSPVEIPPEAITAGLLHDVGKLVMARFLTPEALAVHQDLRHGGASSHQAELSVLGIDHAELGAHIARRWSAPPRIVTAIAHHHEPDRVPVDPATDAVHIGNVAAKLVLAREDLPDDEAMPRLGPVSRLQMPGGFLERLCRHVERRFEEVMARYDAMAAEPGSRAG